MLCDALNGEMQLRMSRKFTSRCQGGKKESDGRNDECDESALTGEGDQGLRRCKRRKVGERQRTQEMSAVVREDGLRSLELEILDWLRMDGEHLQDRRLEAPR